MAGQISAQHRHMPRDYSRLGVVGIASGALIAAFVAAILWGQVALWVDSQLAWLAIGVGVITGLAARFLASSQQSLSVQMIVASAAFIGVVVGKYYIFALLLKAAITDAFGAQAASAFTLFSSATYDFLKEDTGAVVGALNAVWLGVAMFIAWCIPQSMVYRWRRSKSD